MTPSQLFTEKNLIAWGGQEVYSQAQKIAMQGHVLKADLEGALLKGVIRRPESSELYTSCLVHPDGSVESKCPCPTNHHYGRICPHVVALGIMIMRRLADPLLEQKYQEEKRHSCWIQNIANSEYLLRSPRGTPMFICLSLSENWQSEFWKQKEIKLGIYLIEKKNPPDGQSQLFAPQAIPKGRPIKLSDNNENLLSVMEDICEGPVKDSIKVSQSDFLNILENASGARIVSGKQAQWKMEAEAVPVALMVDLDPETGEFHIFPRADYPGWEENDVQNFLVSGNRGVVISRGHIWRIKNFLPLPYHSIYQRDEIIPRDRVVNFLDWDLKALQQITPVILKTPPDLVERIPGKPTFTLELHGSRASLRADLYATYVDHTVTAGVTSAKDAFAVPDPSDILRYYTRNLQAEKSAIRQLLKAGFTFQEDGKLVITESRGVLNFLGSGMARLRRMDWKTKFSPNLQEVVDSLSAITPVVEIQKERPGWFDVGFTFDLPNGMGKIPPAEIQYAINRGDAFLEYNGSTILIDTDSIESMRSVFNDSNCRESSRPGHFRMSQVYAPFIQSSLESMEGIDVDQPADWRKKASLYNHDKNTRFCPIPLEHGLDQILRPYQKQGVYWMRFLEESGLNGLLADEMGLGKTLQTLTWLSLKRIDNEANGKPAIVICPTSLVGNWALEAEKFVPHLKRLVINGPDRNALFEQIPQHDLVITSYALIRRDMENYLPYQFSVAVLDEAQHIKNRTTQNAIAVKQINARNKLVLTGTPIENGVADIWSIMDFLMPDYLGNYNAFHVNYEQPLMDNPQENVEIQEKLRRKLQPFILRRVKKDVAKDLPDKIVKVQYCQMTQDQEQLYNEVLAEYRQKIKDMVQQKGFEKSKFEILAMLMKLRQICCHLWLLKDRTRKPGEEPSSKMDSFLELMDEAIDGGHRILVFSQFVQMLQLIRDELEKRQISYCYLDGSTNNRLEQCQRFNQTPSIPVFLISLKAGGTGLNLTGADMVVHFDPWWNPAVEDQATDRAHRIGQKRTVYSVKLITQHSVEERVLAMQRKKQAIINATIDTSDAAVLSKLTFDDLKDLLGL